MTRLSESDWLKHGLTVLARSGFTALKADPLAKSLGVSRGSFYWHFKDISAYHARLLDYWQANATEEVIRELEEAGADQQKLLTLMTRAFSVSPRLDRAIRNWAQHDTGIKTRLVKIDKMRIAYIVQLLSEMGVSKADADLRARLLYAASIGLPHVAGSKMATLTEDDLRRLSGYMTA